VALAGGRRQVLTRRGRCAPLTGVGGTVRINLQSVATRGTCAPRELGGTKVEPMLQHRLLSPADYRRVPSRSLAGRTTEIASHPAGASPDGVAWRVSIADLIMDGPLAPSPGIERTIVVIAGAGLRLDAGGHDALLCALYEPYTFSGDAAVHCTLIAGPVRDFDLMLRRGRSRGSVTAFRGEGARLPPAQFRLCYAASGACECLLAGHAPLTITADHSLLVEDAAAATPLAVNPVTPDAVALVAAIDLAA
jgi:environmental stress-induced protein Ves